MDSKRLEKLLREIRDAHIAVIGDVCLDIYWYADMTQSELSRETPHFPLPVVEERYYLGAGGNAAANVAGIGCNNVDVITVIGNDWRGYELNRIMAAEGISATSTIQTNNRVTPAYCKPFRKGLSEVVYEDPRLDFANHTALDSDFEDQIVENLFTMSEQVDGVIVSDQFHHGVVTAKVRAAINEVARRVKVFVDSRDRIELFRNAVVKPNELELLAALGSQRSVDHPQRIVEATEELHRQVKGPVCVTLGSKGCFWMDDSGGQDYVAIPVAPPVDIVGAGDAFMAGLATAFSVGASQAEAIELGSLVASINIRKIGMTGVVTRNELLEKNAGLNRQRFGEQTQPVRGGYEGE